MSVFTVHIIEKFVKNSFPVPVKVLGVAHHAHCSRKGDLKQELQSSSQLIFRGIWRWCLYSVGSEFYIVQTTLLAKQCYRNIINLDFRSFIS